MERFGECDEFIIRFACDLVFVLDTATGAVEMEFEAAAAAAVETATVEDNGRVVGVKKSFAIKKKDKIGNIFTLKIFL